MDSVYESKDNVPHYQTNFHHFKYVLMMLPDALQKELLSEALIHYKTMTIRTVITHNPQQTSTSSKNSKWPLLCVQTVNNTQQKYSFRSAHRLIQWLTSYRDLFQMPLLPKKNTKVLRKRLFLKLHTVFSKSCNALLK